jgi:hypothetical protein
MKGLSFNKIDEKYSKVKYLELECIMNMETGYVNVTHFCSAASAGEKNISDYLASDIYKDLITEYTEEGSSAGNRQTINNVTYFHPILFMDLASWISTDAHIMAGRVVSEYFFTKFMEREEDIRSMYISSLGRST